MKSAYFFVKSNYIKNTQKNWVFCLGRLICHQSFTFLEVTSVNPNSDKQWESVTSGNSYNGISRTHQWKDKQSQVARNGTIKFLCNLSEFSSCEIKSVNYNGISKFAVKLVPCGIIKNKKLYLLPDCEDYLMEWCGYLSSFIMQGNSSPVAALNYDTQSMTSSFTLQRTSPDRLTSGNRHSDFYAVSLDENDAYEVGNESEFHLVTIEPTEHSEKIDLRGDYLFKLGPALLELLKITTRDTVHTFPYASIRRFGAKENLFRLEAGRRCSTGNGVFNFLTNDAAHVAEKIRENARLLKMQAPQDIQSLNRLSLGSSQSLTTFPPSNERYKSNLNDIPYATVNRKGVSNSTLIKVTDVGRYKEDEVDDTEKENKIDKNVKSKENDEPNVNDCKIDNKTDGECDKESVDTTTPTRSAQNLFFSDINVKKEISENSTFQPLPPPPPSIESSRFCYKSNTLPVPPSIQQTNNTDAEPEYKVTNSSFFKYRQQRMTPVASAQQIAQLHSNSEPSSHNDSTNVTNLESNPSTKLVINFRSAKTYLNKINTDNAPFTNEINSPEKKSPPPTLPKPKSKSETQCLSDLMCSPPPPPTSPPPLSSAPPVFTDTQESYREFDEMIKRLELSSL